MKNIEAQKRKITIEFGSDEFLDSFHAMLNVIQEERELMDKRHKRIITMFMQDIKIYQDNKICKTKKI